MKSMGMLNPSNNSDKAKKILTIIKKNGNFVLTLYICEPPITVTWSEPEALRMLLRSIDTISESNKKIGWINIIVLSDGKEYFQLALN